MKTWTTGTVLCKEKNSSALISDSSHTSSLICRRNTLPVVRHHGNLTFGLLPACSISSFELAQFLICIPQLASFGMENLHTIFWYPSSWKNTSEIALRWAGSVRQYLPNMRLKYAIISHITEQILFHRFFLVAIYQFLMWKSVFASPISNIILDIGDRLWISTPSRVNWSSGIICSQPPISIVIPTFAVNVLSYYNTSVFWKSQFWNFSQMPVRDNLADKQRYTKRPVLTF